jgi:nitroreductase
MLTRYGHLISATFQFRQLDVLGRFRDPAGMDTWQAINTVRVVREFSDEPISEHDLDRILNAGRRTGSSKNQQHWAFVVVRDREHLRELSAVGRYANHLAGATVAIALVRPAEDPPRVYSALWDLGRAAQNMVLAAWELGIGSVPATVYDRELAGRLLGLPSDQVCDYLLSFGHPADAEKLTAPNKPGGRVALHTIVHEERW